MFKIETGIELQKSNADRRSEVTDTAEALAVGQSFVVPDSSGVKRHRLSGSLNNIFRKNGSKFVTRKVDGGVRVWRLS